MISNKNIIFSVLNTFYPQKNPDKFFMSLFPQQCSCSAPLASLCVPNLPFEDKLQNTHV